eukprot:TRINITY_DN13815_c0_g1_i1.p1 TRINITY_DN13815_c0_g1~~TRINITY_DN13815_c0_g1_i1.p1  ORF type:complete len:201 (-),score=36.11 TRINITY_DN13815_c0_g1_i1:107-709(-)
MAAHPTFVLHYFDFAGRGEPIRQALRLGGVHFTDHRIAFTEWPTVKGTYPLGSIPVLEVDGKKLCNSNTILNYVGRYTGLLPEDPFLAAKVDEAMSVAEDIINAVFPPYRAAKDEDKPAVAEKINKTITEIIKKLETLVVNNGGEWAVGDKFTVADLKLAGLVGMSLSGIPFPQPGVLDGADKLKKIQLAVQAKIDALPK